jgi:hypothetical protein
MKTTKTMIAAVALAVLPTLSFAMCAGKSHEQVVMSCADGTVYDYESKACVAVTG